MKTRAINAADAPQSAGGYAQAIEVSEASRTLFVSGQIPVNVEGSVPESFEDQARLAWANVEAQLRAADMTFDNLVKATVFLSDRAYTLPNRTVRTEILGDRKISLTVIVCAIFDSAWLLEIDAIAMD